MGLRIYPVITMVSERVLDSMMDENVGETRNVKRYILNTNKATSAWVTTFPIGLFPLVVKNCWAHIDSGRENMTCFSS